MGDPMSIVLNSSSGGSVTLNEPTTASNFTHTLPAATGTVMVSGNMPAFSAYSSAGANISSSTWTKVTLDTETFDTNSNFDSTTNYRFTPTVAGYYQINFQIACGSSGNNAYWQWSSIYKNGTSYVSNTNVNGSSALQSFTWATNQLIYMNGSSDYLEFYVNIYVASGTPSYGGGSSSTVVTGFLARAA